MMATRSERDDPAGADCGDSPRTPLLTVSASRLSMWLGPALLLAMGIAGLVLASLDLTGAVEMTSRSRRSSPLVGFVSGLGVLGLARVVLARACSSKGTLIAVDRHRMRIHTLLGVVGVHLDQVEYVTTVKRHGVRGLSVGDADGRIHRPILRPDGDAWDAVADRLNVVLAEYRTRRRSSPGG